jgi:hypothetical protein
MRCEFCKCELPEKGHSHVIEAQGRMGVFHCCAACVKRLGLKIVGLVKA